MEYLPVGCHSKVFILTNLDSLLGNDSQAVFVESPTVAVVKDLHSLLHSLDSIFFTNNFFLLSQVPQQWDHHVLAKTIANFICLVCSPNFVYMTQNYLVASETSHHTS